jgi:hypothetical protein
MASNIQRLLQKTALGGALTAPLIYSLIFPFMLLDLFVTVYQQICFRVYGLPVVKRGEHVVIDRHDLPHMNWRDRLNCAYCDYAQGVLAYVTDVVRRTEYFWCPVKHKSNLHHQTGVYDTYLERDDTQHYRSKLWQTRQKCRACETPCSKS